MAGVARPQASLLLPPAFVCLMLGLVGGLSRMGLVQPPLQQIAQNHGPLMVVGFLAALIAAERALTLNNVLMAVASTHFSLGGLLLMFPLEILNAVLWLGGGIAFLLWSVWTVVKFRKNFSTVFFVAAGFLLLAGNIFFILNYPTTYYVFAWTIFFTSFIVGERMDMLKITKASKASYLSAATSIPMAFMGLASMNKYFFSALFILLLLSVARHDVALRFIKRGGFSRYLSLGLFTAYLWLAVSAVLWLLSSSTDVMLHSVFLGFVGTMVFAHAPIILPALLKTRHFYSPLLYIPFTLLQLSTAIRLVSAQTLQIGLWSLSGALTVVSVVVFIALGPGSTVVRKGLQAR
ncbi:MAG: hypothetical protein RMH74_07740 [Candidatus Caldarchaeum sp.]|nr:hypothetical protein [Candidatus Caldarchaeum sp.]